MEILIDQSQWLPNLLNNCPMARLEIDHLEDYPTRSLDERSIKEDQCVKEKERSRSYNSKF